jgi:hypothetical protein
VNWLRDGKSTPSTTLPGKRVNKRAKKTPRTTMTINYGPADFADLASIESTIERSQIVFRRHWIRLTGGLARRFDLPAGFEDIDVEILEWIAAEGRRKSCDYLPL